MDWCEATLIEYLGQVELLRCFLEVLFKPLGLTLKNQREDSLVIVAIFLAHLAHDLEHAVLALNFVLLLIIIIMVVHNVDVILALRWIMMHLLLLII